MVQERIENGWDAYGIYFMFNQLRGNKNAIIAQMTHEIERFYAKLVKRVIRKPTSPKWQDSLPIMIGFPDLPIPKREKYSLSDVTINDGLHFQSMALIHPEHCRFPEDLETHVKLNEDLYLHRKRQENGNLSMEQKLQRIYVQSTTKTPKYYTGYQLKALTNGKLPDDNYMLILPKTVSELPAKKSRRGAYEDSVTDGNRKPITAALAERLKKRINELLASDVELADGDVQFLYSIEKDLTKMGPSPALTERQVNKTARVLAKTKVCRGNI